VAKRRDLTAFLLIRAGSDLPSLMAGIEDDRDMAKSTHTRADRKARKTSAAMDHLHALQRLASEEPSFAASLKQTGSTQAAARMAKKRGIPISAESLWRNRGRHSLPSWSA
jgi:hypothetical protein